MRKKRECERFAGWCFAQLNVRPCPITCAPGNTLITQDKGVCFGCYTWPPDTSEPGEIFVAYRLDKFAVMSTLAHEIAHHWQQMKTGIESMDESASEEEAERIGLELLARWLIRGGKLHRYEGQRRVKDER